MASVIRSLLRPASRPQAIRSVAPAVLHHAVPRNAFASKSGSDPIQIDSQVHQDLEVGELQGAKFKIEPLRRTGEDETTMRARLLYQCRKRGILESDLVLSTFADTHLPTMTLAQMRNYDLFLDENDWDIYYWATQDESPGLDTTPTKPSSAADDAATPVDVQVRPKGTDEWAQTVGTFKPAYRPVPARWQGSEMLEMLRAHVRSRRGNGEGMAFMPPLFNVAGRTA